MEDFGGGWKSRLACRGVSARGKQEQHEEKDHFLKDGNGVKPTTTKKRIKVCEDSEASKLGQDPWPGPKKI
jgi:hypothetical protein